MYVCVCVLCVCVCVCVLCFVFLLACLICLFAYLFAVQLLRLYFRKYLSNEWFGRGCLGHRNWNRWSQVQFRVPRPDPIPPLRGRTITNVRFADDIDGLAGEEKELANLVERLYKASTAYDMEISAEKTKLMTNNTNGINTEIKVNGQRL